MKFCQLLLLSGLLVGALALFNCPRPPLPRCPHSLCPEIDNSTCRHGVITDICDCCTVCGIGPGDYCGLKQGHCDFGTQCFCGAGLKCEVGYSDRYVSEDARVLFEGLCAYYGKFINF